MIESGVRFTIEINGGLDTSGHTRALAAMLQALEAVRGVEIRRAGFETIDSGPLQPPTYHPERNPEFEDYLELIRNGTPVRTGTLLRAWRKQNGLTVTALGKGLGFSKGYVSQLEIGRIVQPTDERLQIISNFTGIDMGILRSRTGS